MNIISNESLNFLEKYCDLACDIITGKMPVPKNKILNKIKREIRLKRTYKLEGNFAYICYDISNFDKILEGGAKVLKESERLYKQVKQVSLLYIKQYKLLVNNEDIVYLEISQELTQTSLSSKSNIEKEHGLHLPIFICEYLTISFTQDGIKQKVCQKHYNIEKMKYLNSRIFKEVSKLITVKVENRYDQYYNVEIYHDNNLVVTSKDKNVIGNYLKKQLKNKIITDKDLVFNSKVTSEKEPIWENYWVFVSFAENEESKQAFNLKFNARKLICELTNGSKIRIVITKLENTLENKEVTLDYFVKKVLRENFEELYLNSLFDTKTVITSKLITKDRKPLTIYSIRDERKERLKLKLEIQKENSMFLPISSYHIDEFVIDKNIILARFLKKSEIDGKVYLYQYSYVERSKNRGEDVEKIVLRIVYQMKNATYSVGEVKRENVIIPDVCYEKCCAIILDKEKDLILNFKKTYIPDVDDFYLTEKIFNALFELDKCYVSVVAHDLEFFGGNTVIDFSKKEFVSFQDLLQEGMYKIKSSQHLSKEQIEALENYYNNH